MCGMLESEDSEKWGIYAPTENQLMAICGLACHKRHANDCVLEQNSLKNSDTAQQHPGGAQEDEDDMEPETARCRQLQHK